MVQKGPFTVNSAPLNMNPEPLEKHALQTLVQIQCAKGLLSHIYLEIIWNIPGAGISFVVVEYWCGQALILLLPRNTDMRYSNNMLFLDENSYFDCANLLDELHEAEYIYCMN